MQTDILTRTSFFALVGLGLAIAVAGCGNSALDTGASALDAGAVFGSLSKDDLGYQILSIDDLDTLEHSGVAIKWGSGAVISEDPAPPPAPAAAPTLGGDQIEGLKQYDELKLVRGNGAKGGTLEASWVKNGVVRSFWLNGTLYDWDDGCYHPMRPKRMWHYYKFEKISPGVYKYVKHSLGHGDPVMESGSATSMDG